MGVVRTAKKDTDSDVAEPMGSESDLTSIAVPEPEIGEEPPRRFVSMPSTPTQTATAEYLCDIFNGLSWILGSKTQFNVREFAGMAKSLHTLAAQVPVIGVLLRILGPLTIVFQVVSKWRRILDGRPAKPEQAEQAVPFVPEEPVFQPAPTAPGEAAEGAGGDPVMVVVPDLAPSDHPESPLVAARRYG